MDRLPHQPPQPTDTKTCAPLLQRWFLLYMTSRPLHRLSPLAREVKAEQCLKINGGCTEGFSLRCLGLTSDRICQHKKSMFKSDLPKFQSVHMLNSAEAQSRSTSYEFNKSINQAFAQRRTIQILSTIFWNTWVTKS